MTMNGMGCERNRGTVTGRIRIVWVGFRSATYALFVRFICWSVWAGGGLVGNLMSLPEIAGVKGVEEGRAGEDGLASSDAR